jgi:hypothetical protein
MDGSEHGDAVSSPVKQVEYEDEFGEDELGQLVKSEGLSEILQLILQEQADDFMNEEITEGDDYVDWIRWVADAEQSMRAECTPNDNVTFMLQQPQPTNTPSTPTLRQIVQIDNDNSDRSTTECLDSSNHEEVGARWNEICQRIKVDRNLDEGRQKQLFEVLEQYQDVFAWNKGELGCCTVGEHVINTQGFPPCRATPGRLSY